MPRSTPIQSFLTEFQIKGNKPLSEAQLARAERELGFALPAALKKWYLTHNGGRAGNDRSALELFSLNEGLGYGDVPGFLNSAFGHLPVAENNDSNPVCVCCKSPLAGFVVRVAHDDDPRLLYRSLDGFFRAAVEFVRGGEFLDTHELPGEFDGPERTPKDRTTARKLIALANEPGALDDRDRVNALRFACDLLADADLNEIAGLLEIDNEYVREHVTARLQRIPGAKAKKALGRLTDDYDAFVERCAATLKNAGINASIQAPHGKNTIRIDPGPVWLNTEHFYNERQRPDFDEYLLERARFFIADEKKRRKR